MNQFNSCVTGSMHGRLTVKSLHVVLRTYELYVRIFNRTALVSHSNLDIYTEKLVKPRWNSSTAGCDAGQSLLYSDLLGCATILNVTIIGTDLYPSPGCVSQRKLPKTCCNIFFKLEPFSRTWLWFLAFIVCLERAKETYWTSMQCTPPVGC